jgi:ABC-type cobalamin/Fe3+-siderophores transport system ATPase subunit
MRAALEFSAASVAAGGRTILQELNLSVPARGLFGVVGPNGAGKSTLVKAALGLIPLAHGQIQVLGQEIGRWSPRGLAKHMGYVPQHVHSHWDLNVSELLQLGLSPPSQALIDEWELEPLLHRRLATLSGGEQARASIARALTHQPALLMADEPAAHLDLPHQHQLMHMLRQRGQRHAVLMVLHDLHLAAHYCDLVAVVAASRLVACGPPEEVLTPDVLTRAYGAQVLRLQTEGHVFFSAPSGNSPLHH